MRSASIRHPVASAYAHACVAWECDPKHARALLCEFWMKECKGKETPITKEGMIKQETDPLLQESRQVRSGGGHHKLMAQGSPTYR